MKTLLIVLIHRAATGKKCPITAIYINFFNRKRLIDVFYCKYCHTISVEQAYDDLPNVCRCIQDQKGASSHHRLIAIYPDRNSRTMLSTVCTLNFNLYIFHKIQKVSGQISSVCSEHLTLREAHRALKCWSAADDSSSADPTGNSPTKRLWNSFDMGQLGFV